ncbi:uncharacterized protein B0H18DRAFT_1119866 [Fomitopsis serialis]|uniref:uncharacterized protein n=1 Tax=Fomitopsis serialis TaxID=139415 RepID=UPI002008ABD1|nr:uncharacterized protein B0H18DRAFT_1119866 [Neoantrodia serialis]KAH9924528.1 hypothetical protein B0H18DRAFT_1119866 [Neoantrodia serialis]
MLDFYRRPSTWLEGNPRSSSKTFGQGRAQSQLSSTTSNDPETAVDNQSTAGRTTNGNGDRRSDRELRDLKVMFPEGQLSVVTGPTASGKTTLLMALLGEMTRRGKV